MNVCFYSKSYRYVYLSDIIAHTHAEIRLEIAKNRDQEVKDSGQDVRLSLPTKIRDVWSKSDTGLPHV